MVHRVRIAGSVLVRNYLKIHFQAFPSSAAARLSHRIPHLGSYSKNRGENADGNTYLSTFAQPFQW